jgi:hypothetical protein
LPNGSEQVIYVPKVAGRYLIHVQFDGQPVPGSPFAVSATGSDKRKTNKVEQSQKVATKTLQTNQRKQVIITTECKCNLT